MGRADTSTPNPVAARSGWGKALRSPGDGKQRNPLRTWGVCVPRPTEGNVSLGSSVQEKHRVPEAGPVECNKDD